MSEDEERIARVLAAASGVDGAPPITADDLQYAADLWRSLRAADDESTAVAVIATSLAGERERARAPFLRLADYIWGAGVVMGSRVAADIRRAAEDGQ